MVCAPLVFVCVWDRLVLNQRFLMMYTPLIFCMRRLYRISPQVAFFQIVCAPLVSVCEWHRLVPSQRFLMTYTPLILVYFLYAARVHTWHFNQRFLAVYSRLIFVWFLNAKRLSRPLNQRFLMTYSWLIFLYVGCLACANG